MYQRKDDRLCASVFASASSTYRDMGKQSRRTRTQQMSESTGKTEMPGWMVHEIMTVITDKWRGTLAHYKEDDLRNAGLWDAIFCEHNEQIAARCVFEAYNVTFPASNRYQYDT